MNPYIPLPVRIRRIVTETEDRMLKSFDLEFVNRDDNNNFRFTPGQFCEISILGKGEAPFGIASSPTEEGFLKFTVNRVGVVTTAMHELETGDELGLRGPLGNFYPVDDGMKGKNVVVIGGGFAFTTLRSLCLYMMHDAHRADYGSITVIYGARTPGMLLYKDELRSWNEREDIDVHLTIDTEAEGWDGLVGFVPPVVEKIAPSPDNAVVILCGPPIMIKFTMPPLEKLGFPLDRIYTSLENRMKCGFGKCGRCNIGDKYVCKDGPVFTCEQLAGMPAEY